MCKLPEGMRFSFSTLQEYQECPMAVKLRKIDGYESVGNAYSDYGTLLHALIEENAAGDIPSFAMAEEYEERYANAIHSYFPPYPKGLAETYYNEGLNFFMNFEGFDNEYDVVAIEEEFQYEIEGYPFIGYADLILKKKANGSVKLVDIKSKSAKNMKKDYAAYRNQLYLYAEGMKNKFGYYPDEVSFFVPRANEWFEEPFDPAQLEATKKWAVSVIKSMEADKEWLVSPNAYRCRWICGCRDACPAFWALQQAELEKKRMKEEMMGL